MPLRSGWASITGVLGSRKFWNAAILSVVAAAAGVVSKGTWEKYFAEKPIYIPIAVVPLKGAPGEVVPGADVDLGVPGISSKQTDPFGHAYFENVASAFRGKIGHVTIRKEGFLPPKVDEYPITIQPRDWKNPFLVSIAKIPLPPPPLPPPPVREKLTRVYRSGPLPSGPGSSFSQWYSLCSQEDVPAAYVIESEIFKLVGDRSCGAWANCGEDHRTARQVCWRFQMQGHNEWGLFNSGQGVAASEGLLTVVWAPQ